MRGISGFGSEKSSVQRVIPKSGYRFSDKIMRELYVDNSRLTIRAV